MKEAAKEKHALERKELEARKRLPGTFLFVSPTLCSWLASVSASSASSAAGGSPFSVEVCGC
jgi:hypothetical protein